MSIQCQYCEMVNILGDFSVLRVQGSHETCYSGSLREKLDTQKVPTAFLKGAKDIRQQLERKVALKNGVLTIWGLRSSASSTLSGEAVAWELYSFLQGGVT